MFERYTERARRVIFFARYEASQFGSRTIETEHLLLGLIREDKNVTNRFLGNTSSIESIRKEIEARSEIREKVSVSIDLPMTEQSKNILKYAAEESERMAHRTIGTEHLLLGMLREEAGVAAQILFERGLVLDRIRREVEQSGQKEDSGEQAAGMMSQLARTMADFKPRAPLLGMERERMVPDADTARLIAQAIWIPVYGAETVGKQSPPQIEQKLLIWIVTGIPASGSNDGPLFAYIRLTDGKVLAMGQKTAGSDV